MRFIEYQASSSSSGYLIHADTPLQDAGMYSSITVLVYLNSDFEGGSLRFLDQDSHLDVFPKEGLVVLFPHKLLHQAAAVTSGSKQLLKLSVLYSARPQRSTISPLQADMEERLPFHMASTSATKGSLSEAKAHICKWFKYVEIKSYFPA